MSTEHRPGEARFLEARILVPFLITALIWGSTWIAIKYQLGDVPPSWSVTWRFTGGALGMFALVLLQRLPLVPDRKGLIVATVMGCSVFSLNFQFVYRSEQYITSGLVAVLFALLLVPNTVLSRIFLGQRITRGFLAGTAIALVGIALLMLHEYRLALAQNAVMGAKVIIGGLMVMTALLFASVGNVVQASPAARGQPVPTLLAWAMLIGATVDGTIAWVISGPPRFDWTLPYAGGVAYLAIVGTVVTFPMYNGLLRALGPGRAAYNGVLVPVVAMLISTVFEGYRWSLLAGSGAALAMIGLVVALRARNPSR
ncbi:multidrug transporter [Novosphingobium fuchskuhlense]|uniref:Multidrug transporter n=1 Tax=Novosphingobium fuchskuhlense TaxID=1117702 RepID=A0A117UWY1_9SPHN|nr:EamA family transporter [Novosphingobium fuchskuhlense]KUR72371.1 multidrug transporter [Novosphingobium fuchskuhlense]